MSVVAIFAEAILEYGAIGLLALAGWTLAGWFLWRDYKKKESYNFKLAEKEKLVAAKDNQLLKSKEDLARMIEDLSKERINDLKEITEDYNKVASSTIHTLDKLTTALDVRNSINK